MAKIAIVGLPSSGKSTFALQLGNKLNIPVYHLDKIIFGSNNKKRDKSAIESEIKHIVAKDAWILEGCSISTLEMRYAKADTIFYFDYSRLRCLCWLLKRVVHKNNTGGCLKGINWGILSYMWTFHKRQFPKIQEMRNKYPNVDFQIFRRPKDTDPYNQLVSKISKLLKSKERVFIAISGFGGAGKTTLADRLGKHFKIKENEIVRIDHLYSQNPNGPGMLDQVDWPLVTQILEEAHAGKKLKFTGRGYHGEDVVYDEELPNVVIFEGIRLLGPKLSPYFDITVWIDCPQEIALERAKARDRAQGEDEETIKLWDTDWGPKDKAYFETYRPDRLATFLY